MKAPDFDRKTRQRLARWYVKNVGYDPTKEDPKTSTVDGKGRKRDHPDSIPPSKARVRFD